MPLDLEEQEHVDELKAWWSRYGTLVVSLAAALAIGATGWALWRNYQAGETAKASAVYDNLAKAAQAGDAKALRDSGGALTEGFPRTLYASMGALVSARFYFDRNDLKSAKAQLQWVIDRSPSDDLRELARLRLGGILLDEKAHDEALKIADTAHAAAYDAQYAALKGDVLVAKGQAAEAKAAYKLALDKAGKESAAFRESVRMRLEALGG
jgi:predicted negative regulator of RcsB-dependent stress response